MRDGQKKGRLTRGETATICFSDATPAIPSGNRSAFVLYGYTSHILQYF